MNNNQKVPDPPNAAARLSQLPVVRSACSALSLIYANAKQSLPSLRSACRVLEGGAVTLGTVASPVLVKLQPQMCVADAVACQSLDWLERTFPVLQAPTDEIFTTAKNKIQELQTVVTVIRTVDYVMWMMQKADDGTNRTLMRRTVGAVGLGLDSALLVVEALMDRVLPPNQDTKTASAASAASADPARGPPRGGHAVRLTELTVELYHRSCCRIGEKLQLLQVETLSRSSSLVQDLQTSCWSLVWGLQDQAVSVVVFFSQMYQLSVPPSDPDRSAPPSDPDRSAPTKSPPNGADQKDPATPKSCRTKPPKISPRAVERARCLR